MTTAGEPEHERRLPRPGALDVATSILVAFNFAVAQPVLDLTGRFPQFFLARRSPKIDLVLLAVGLAIAIPAVVALMVWVSGLIHRRIGTAAHVLVLGALTGSLFTQILERIPGFKGLAAPVLIAAAIVLAAVLVVAYYRVHGVRRFVRFAAVSAVALPLLFLFSSPASRLVLRQSTVISGSTLIGNPVPVVVVVVDELPIASLMTADRTIDTGMFPGFARLAAGSTWFRNATAVHDFTEIAVPAILTGSYGDKHKLPIASHYPKNIFSLLGGAYDIRAFEAFTQLCPATICRETAKPAAAFWQRWRGMASDLRIIYEHIVAPPSLEGDLPPIDQTWSDFGAGPGKASVDQGQGGGHSNVVLIDDPLADFRDLIRSVEPVTRPTLWFAHIELPHAPWRYLPSGQEYPQRSPIPGRDGKTWGSDEWLLAQAYQRHLLQTATVDRKLNELIDRLQETGVYDRALMIVTADHGISFTPGENLRVAAKQTLGEIAAVPMFVKLPGQTKGDISDRPVETFDVVPTIADVLGVDGMYPTDGVSVFAPGPARTGREIRSMRGHRVSFGVGGKEKDAVLARKLALFGRTGGIERLYALAPDRYASLLGAEPPGNTGQASGRAFIDSAESYAHLNPVARLVRCLVSGRLTGVSTTPQILAVALEGRIVAVTRTFVKSGEVRFHAMIAPDAFRRGANELKIYLVQSGDHAPALRLLPQEG